MRAHLSTDNSLYGTPKYFSNYNLDTIEKYNAPKQQSDPEPIEADTAKPKRKRRTAQQILEDNLNKTTSTRPSKRKRRTAQQIMEDNLIETTSIKPSKRKRRTAQQIMEDNLIETTSIKPSRQKSKKYTLEKRNDMNANIVSTHATQDTEECIVDTGLGHRKRKVSTERDTEGEDSGTDATKSLLGNLTVAESLVADFDRLSSRPKRKKKKKAKTKIKLPLPTESDYEVHVGGIDYGSGCAAVCVFKGMKFSFENCKIMFVTDKKRRCGSFLNGQLVGNRIAKDTMGMVQFLEISKHFGTFLAQEKPTTTGLEGYSMSNSHMSYLIGEHMGILKYHLHQLDIEYTSYSPKSVKLTGTGFGRAEKEDMVIAFTKETGINLSDVFNTRGTTVSPINDIVDAYYVCKHHVGMTILKQQELAEAQSTSGLDGFKEDVE